MDRIICVSYPRSGCRFLRNLIIECFPDDFIFYESYRHKFIPDDQNLTPDDANLIKTHDFELVGKSILSDIYPSNRKYIIQIRKPLDAIISWYELDLKKNSESVDSELSWLNFLESKLIFWKNFYDLWVRNLSSDSVLVLYDDLFYFTLETLSKVFKFINIRKQLDINTLKQNINHIPFLQYVSDLNSVKDKKRDIKEFKYYDENKFNSIIDELEREYPLNLKIIN